MSLLVISIFYIRVYRHIYKVSCHQRFETIGRKGSRSSSSPLTLLSNNTNHRCSISSYLDNKGFINNFIEKFCKNDDSIINENNLIKKKSDFIPAANLNNIEEIDFENETTEKMNPLLVKKSLIQEDGRKIMINEECLKDQNIGIYLNNIVPGKDMVKDKFT